MRLGIERGEGFKAGAGGFVGVEVGIGDVGVG